MPLWPPRLLIDEGLPHRRVAAIFPNCDVVRCELQGRDSAIVMMARDEHAVIVCSDRDFYGSVRIGGCAMKMTLWGRFAQFV